jgi:hypothetical protein
MLNEDQPFVLKIEPGTTEIDLGPILRPIIWAIREEIRTHEGRQHWGSRNEKKAAEIEPDGIDAVMQQAIDNLTYQRLLRQLTRPLLVRYLEDHGWKDEDGRGYVYVRDYYNKDRSWDYHGDKLHLHSPDKKLELSVAEDVIYRLSYDERKTKLKMVRTLLAYDNVLDRIVDAVGELD